MAKQSFKEVVSQSTSILSGLKARKFSPIYLLMGEETYHIDLIANYIARHALTADEQEFNQVVLYGKDSGAEAVISQARRYPMMAERQVVIVREAQSMSGFEQLIHYANSPMLSTVLVLCYKGKSLDKRSMIYKQISKVGTVFETVMPRDYEIAGWIADMVKSRGLSIEPKAVQMLGEHIGANLEKISSEIDKLITRLPDATRSITAEDIERNVGISKDFNNFELTRALSERDFRRALVIAEYFASNAKDNPLVVTLSLLFVHFQRIVILNIHKWDSQKRGAHIGSEYDLAKLLKLPNAYFVGEYVTASNNYPGAKASAILGLIRQWDGKSKGMNVGSMAPEGLLRELILRISLI